jgi:predicted lipoprotein with Yx(FWY)xxD motif
VRTKIVTCLLASALVLGACGGDDDDETTSDAGTEQDSGAAGEAVGAALVDTGDTALGPVLTDAEGRTLYAFTNDSEGTSSCEGACAEAWPPVTVEGSELPEGLDADVFSVIERSGEEYQLAANGAPLYTYAADTGPGDTNGQGSGGVWWVVTPEGDLNRSDAAGATTAPPADDSDSGSGDDPY